MANKTCYIDITNDWLSKATPNSHQIKELNYWIINNKKRKVDGKNIVLDYSKSEYECAKWLEKTFGGELYLCPRVNVPKGIRTPDFIWNGEYWDLKEIRVNGHNVIDNRLNMSRNQANNFIINIMNNNLTNNNIFKQIEKIFKSTNRKWINKIILKRNNKIIGIFINNKN